MDFFKIIKFINIAGIIHGFILSAAIFHARTKGRKCLVFLSLLIFVYSIGNLSNILIHTFLADYSWHKFLLVPFYAIIGTIFYFYIASFTESAVKVPKIFHFISFILIGISFIISQSFNEFDPAQNVIDIIITFAISIQVIGYCVLSVAAFLSYQKKICEFFSSTDKFRILWLKFFLAASFVSWICLLIIEFTFHREDAYNIYWLLISLIVYAIGYIGIKQPEVLEHIDTVPKKKYEKTAIDPEKIKEYEEKLSLLVKEDVFLDPDISLSSLAEKIGVHSYQLSQIINEKGMNFYEYINRMRIDYAKNLIIKNQDILNIARVAFDSGFNSISAFNSAFKKFSGITPSEFAKKNLV